jgi:hypothetical protein
MNTLSVIVASVALSCGVATAQYTPIDLRPIMNADPLSTQKLFFPESRVHNPPSLWLEGETADAHPSRCGAEDMPAASAGKVLGRDWGAVKGDWAEWYFDLPWQTEGGFLFLRFARPTGPERVPLAVTLNSEPVATEALRRNASDTNTPFARGFTPIPLGRLRMGRQVLRLALPEGGAPVALDGMWVSDGTRRVLNRLDEHGRIAPLPTIRMLLYTPGIKEIESVPIDLVDTFANHRRAMFLSKLSEAPLTFETKGETGEAVYLLGAGEKNAVMVAAHIRYADGTEEEQPVSFGSLFDAEPTNPALPMGRGRWAYLARIPIQSKAVAVCRLTANENQDFVLFAATIGPKPTP